MKLIKNHFQKYLIKQTELIEIKVIHKKNGELELKPVEIVTGYELPNDGISEMLFSVFNLYSRFVGYSDFNLSQIRPL